MTPIPERTTFICAEHYEPFVIVAGEYSLYYHCKVKKCRAHFSFAEAQQIYTMLEEAQEKGIALDGFAGKTKNTSFVVSVNEENGITVTVQYQRYKKER